MVKNNKIQYLSDFWFIFRLKVKFWITAICLCPVLKMKARSTLEHDFLKQFMIKVCVKLCRISENPCLHYKWYAFHKPSSYSREASWILLKLLNIAKTLLNLQSSDSSASHDHCSDGRQIPTNGTLTSLSSSPIPSSLLIYNTIFVRCIKSHTRIRLQYNEDSLQSWFSFRCIRCLHVFTSVRSVQNVQNCLCDRHKHSFILDIHIVSPQETYSLYSEALSVQLWPKINVLRCL